MKPLSFLTLAGLAVAFVAPALAAEVPSIAGQSTGSGEPARRRPPAPLTADDLGKISAGESVTTDVLTNQQLRPPPAATPSIAGSVVNGNINFSGNSLRSTKVSAISSAIPAITTTFRAISASPS